MKKILGLLIAIIILSLGGYFIYVNYIKEEVPKITPEEEKVSISEYYIYGNHLNLKGYIEIEDTNYSDIQLTLFDGEDNDIEIITETEGNKISFYFSEYINEGLLLDTIEKGTHYLFLKLTYENEENIENPIKKYYVLNNETEYKEATYYTLSNYNNKILINSNNEYNTMSFITTENNSRDEIVDITIDPGHGGMDGGGSKGEYKESDFTMRISQKIKENLEEVGLKIKLTHKEGDLTTNDLLDEYNEHGRAVIPNEVKSKYTFSIHINKNTSSSVKGLEVYTPSSINYDLAKSIVENITSYSSINTSTNRLYKMYNGVYTHNFTENEIKTSMKGYKDKGYNPYNVTTNSNYLYMIRETGGYMTGAYVDDSNPEEVGVNPYYNSNIGNESYLLELGYLSNSTDLNILLEEEDMIAKAISDAIIKEVGL
ncbi:MAG: N-acetylmuramoyl-L-alanine amidase [Bacilli bacterium]|nr:N-acetylmuramoyl-L-alanine amidase [Bacilli bacterium]